MSSKRCLTINTVLVSRENVHVLQHPKVEIYLLGTNHLSRLSAVAARSLIQHVDPHVVATELCLRRLKMANTYDPQKTDIMSFREQYQLLVHIPKHRRRRAAIELQRVRLIYQAIEYAKRIRSEDAAGNGGIDISTDDSFVHRDCVSKNSRCYKVSPVEVEDTVIGADVFAPFGNLTWQLESMGAMKVLSNLQTKYKILLIDKPIEETYLKIASALSDEEMAIVQQYIRNFIELFESNRTGIMTQMWRANTKIAQAEMDERNRYMAFALLRASRLRTKKPVRVVAIVGRRHVAGIVEIWHSEEAMQFLEND